MRLKIVMLSGVTRQNRHQVMADINDAISAAGGWVSNHSLFSNIAATVHFALSPGRFTTLSQRIAEIGVRLDEESIALLETLPDTPPLPEDEINASLNITFIHDEPDLSREVPAVPG